METITNPSLSRLCRKNTNKGVFGWFKSNCEGWFVLVLVWKLEVWNPSMEISYLMLGN